MAKFSHLLNLEWIVQLTKKNSFIPIIGILHIHLDPQHLSPFPSNLKVMDNFLNYYGILPYAPSKDKCILNKAIKCFKRDLTIEINNLVIILQEKFKLIGLDKLNWVKEFGPTRLEIKDWRFGSISAANIPRKRNSRQNIL